MLYDEDDYETRSPIIKPYELNVHPLIFCLGYVARVSSNGHN